jgi:hypothetical protein
MKRFTIVATAAFLAAIFLICPAFSKDRGDETVRMQDWKCEHCNILIMTFNGDGIGAHKTEHTSYDYQQANWVALYDRSRRLPPCEKSGTKGHAFRQNGMREVQTREFAVDDIKRNIIVLKSGSERAGILIRDFSCVFPNCFFTNGICFYDDDMDMHESIEYSRRLEVYNTSSRYQIDECRGKVVNTPTKSHVIVFGESSSRSSIWLAENFGRLYHSN